MIPQQPNFIKTPFAQNGNRNVIPDENNGTQGLASFSLGFPQITETPIAIGGIPPQRKDFNGILNALSAFCFYAQSGGIFTYSATANYSTPAVVKHGNALWYCVQENGVDSVNGVKTPGTDNNYWILFIDYLLGQASRPVGVPIGSIIMWASWNNPTDGVWLDCNGQSCADYPALVSILGSNSVPNLQGLFPRCTGSQTVAGTTYGVGLGEKQGDAIRNITGYFSSEALPGGASGGVEIGGAFYLSGTGRDHVSGNIDSGNNNYSFDASRVVPTAYENRPAFVGLRFLIKAA